ncbi:glucose uptake inhibitor SgrT [Enterobacter hormaechei]
MKRLTARQFYQHYFSATREVSWLARQCAAAAENLEDLMQWDVRNRPLLANSPGSCVTVFGVITRQQNVFCWLFCLLFHPISIRFHKDCACSG